MNTENKRRVGVYGDKPGIVTRLVFLTYGVRELQRKGLSFLNGPITENYRGKGIQNAEQLELYNLAFIPNTPCISMPLVEKHLGWSEEMVLEFLPYLEEWVEKNCEDKRVNYGPQYFTQQSKRLEAVILHMSEDAKKLMIAGLNETERRVYEEALRYNMTNYPYFVSHFGYGDAGGVWFLNEIDRVRHTLPNRPKGNYTTNRLAEINKQVEAMPDEQVKRAIMAMPWEQVVSTVCDLPSAQLKEFYARKLKNDERMIQKVKKSARSQRRD